MKLAKAKPKGKPLKAAPLPFHNIITREMAYNHAIRLKTRMDRIAAEKANNYQTEYNNIAGSVLRRGGSEQQACADARRHFDGIQGAQHLPK